MCNFIHNNLMKWNLNKTNFLENYIWKIPFVVKIKFVNFILNEKKI